MISWDGCIRLRGNVSPKTLSKTENGERPVYPKRSCPRISPLLPLVDERTLLSGPIWIPPRVGDDLSTAAQVERALNENFAVALRHNKGFAISSRPHSTGCPFWSVGPAHRRLDTIERRVNILTRARIADVQGLTVEPQRHIGMPLKVARVPPLARKIMEPDIREATICIVITGPLGGNAVAVDVRIFPPSESSQ